MKVALLIVSILKSRQTTSALFSCIFVLHSRFFLEVRQGSTLEKKPWGQLAPKFLDLVASANFLVAKNFRPSAQKLSLEISAVQTVHTAFSSARRKSKDEKPYVKKPLMFHCF